MARPRKASVSKDLRNPTRPWVVRWSESTEDGRRVRRGESFVRQRDAERFANRKTRELRGEIKPPVQEPAEGLGDTPLGVFVDEYIRRREAEGVRAATVCRYRHHLGRLTSHFGAGRSVASVTTDDLAKFLAEQRNITNRRRGEALSKSSRNGIVRDIRTLFSHAKEWGYVTKSPTDGIRMLKVNEDDRRGWHYFSPNDIQAVIRVAPLLRDRAAFTTLYGTGLRFGELFNLHPDDVDLGAGYVHVKPREATAGTPPFKLKDHERRSVPMPKFVSAYIRELKATLPKGHPYLFLSAERCGRVRQRWQAMCNRGEGATWQNRLMVNNVLRKLKLYTTKAGITLNGPVTVHSLRKSYGRNGARCLPADVLKAYMGHSDIATTLTYYSKREADDDVKARWALDAMMNSESVPNLVVSDVQSDVQHQERQNRSAG